MQKASRPPGTVLMTNITVVASRYGFNGRRFDPRKGGLPLGLTSLLYKGYRVSLREIKRLGRGAKHPPTSSAVVLKG